MGELIKLFAELGVTPPTLIICYLLFRSVKTHESVLDELRKVIASHDKRLLRLEWENTDNNRND
jgi:hypothetical protein